MPPELAHLHGTIRRALGAAGVHVEELQFDSMIHGFVDMVFSPAADEAVTTSLARFTDLLHPDREDTP